MAKQVKIEWTHSTGNTVAPTSHIVQRSATENGTYTTIYTALGVTAEHTDTNVADGETWWYRVGAVFASGTIKYLAAEDITISSSSYILDTYPNAAAAYSLQQLKTGVTSVVEVRRGNDSAVADFTASEILDGTLTAWTGANGGFISKWYDQSGNANHAVQTVTTKQPKLVVVGVVQLTNGKPAIDFLDNVETGLSANRVLSTSTYAIHYVAEIVNLASSSADTNQAILSQNSGSTDINRTTIVQQVDSDATNVGFFNNGASYPLISTTAWTTGQKINQRYQIAGEHKTLIGAGSYETVVSGQINAPMDYVFSIGNGFDSDGTTFKNCFDGKIQEIIVWESDQESNRVAIDTEIKTRY